MHSEPYLDRILAAPAQSKRAVTTALAIVAILLWVLAAYGQTTASMAAIWARSETFAHGFVIVPLFLFLLWREKESLASIELKPFPLALLGILAAGAIWFLAARLRVNSVAQFAMIASIPFAVWAVLGTNALRMLSFPLGFLFFAVPFGEFMMPTLMEWTADVTVIAVRASGVPVYREGNYFMIPTGRWSVVEACSGLRYLIASFMVGCLFAYLSFRSAFRRMVFIAVSLFVPIVANWIRAYAIVMLGHLSGNRIAAGADHLLFGWVFFGLVMATLFWFGARWREDGSPLTAPKAALVTTSVPRLQRRRLQGALLAVLVATAIWPLLDSIGESSGTVTQRSGLSPLAGRNGWTAVPDALSDWRPDISGATTTLTETFAKDGSQVGLFIAFFNDPSGEAKAITSTNQLVLTTNRQWTQMTGGKASVDRDGSQVSVRTGVVTRDRERLAVWQWYWIDGRVTASDFLGKLYEAVALLRGHGRPVAWIVVYTPTESGEEQVRVTLQAFTAAMHDPIEAALRQAAGPR